MAGENIVRKEEIVNSQRAETEVGLSDYLEYSASVNIPVMNVSELIEDTNQKEESSTEDINVISLQEIKILKTEQTEPIFDEPLLSLSDLDDMSKSQAIMLADKISDEVHRFWTRKDAIKSTLSAVDKRNAYSFIRSMLNVSKTRTVLGDIKNYITYTELRHFILAVLKQAEDVGFAKNFQYKRLKKEYDKIVNEWSRSPNKKPRGQLISILNSKLENLFEEMSKKH